MIWFDEADIQLLNRAFLQLRTDLQIWAESVVKAMKIWWPVISGAHRSEVKRIHRQYDRRRRSRKRRK
jgi:hypothetical protein